VLGSTSLDGSSRLLVRGVTDDYEQRIREQEAAHQRQLQQLMGKAEDHEGSLTQQHRERVRTLYREIDHNVEAIDQTRTQLKEREQQLQRLQLDYQLQLEQLRGQFASQLQEETDGHREQLDQLQGELQLQRQRLEETSRVAAAAVETGTLSLDTIRKQVLQQHKQIEQMRKKHKREVGELRRLLELRPAAAAAAVAAAAAAASAAGADGAAGFAGDLDPVTELEYLRNILFEYMMGKEPLTLAKVIAAVLKFSQDQTQKVLEREEHRQSAQLLRPDRTPSEDPVPVT